MTRDELLALADTYARIAKHLDGLLQKRPVMDYPATFAASNVAKQFYSALRALAQETTE